jgi:hypothetical protein
MTPLIRVADETVIMSLSWQRNLRQAMRPARDRSDDSARGHRLQTLRPSANTAAVELDCANKSPAGEGGAR